MPRVVTEAGLANKVVSLQTISDELLRCVAVARPTVLTRERIA